MPDTLDDRTIERSLRASVLDGACWAVMFGAGESYLRRWAIHWRADEPTLALLGAVPLFLAGFAQVLSANLQEVWPHRKRLFMPVALLQALTWIPMAALPVLWPQKAAGSILAVACLYFACAYFTTPPWNSLMGDLVPPERRGAYFAGRLRIVNACTLAALLLGGWLLHAAAGAGRPRLGFAAIFGISLAARLASCAFLARMHEPAFRPSPRDRFSIVDFVRRAPKSNFARFVGFVSLVLFGAHIGGPFIDLWQIRDLGFDDMEYAVSLSVAALAQILTLQSWGRIGDRFGNRKILVLTSVLMPAVPLIWCLGGSFAWVLVCQAVAGTVWAGFNLASANFLFDAVTPGKRARCVAYYNLFMNTGVLLGSLLGGRLAAELPASIAIGGHALAFRSNLPFLFILSGLVRGAVVLLFLPLFKEVRPVEPIRTWKLFFRVLHVNAFQGAGFDILGEDRRMRPADGEPASPEQRRGGDKTAGGI